MMQLMRCFAMCVSVVPVHCDAHALAKRAASWSRGGNSPQDVQRYARTPPLDKMCDACTMLSDVRVSEDARIVCVRENRDAIATNIVIESH